jgi:hypothetical protein
MKTIFLRLFCAACLVAVLAASGCVAPPVEKTPSAGTSSANNPAGPGSAETTPGNTGILADATPFQVTGTPTMAYSRLVEATPIPEDMVCLVDFTQFDASLEVNKSAKKFDLKNPPMYINYTITKPFNVTGTRVVKSRSGTNEEITQTYSYYSPYSYLEIVARNPATGEIYTQDGFGKGYGTSLNKTIQISKTGNLLIEINAYNVTPTIGFWVKPSGNFENSTVDFSTRECLSQAVIKKLNHY